VGKPKGKSMRKGLLNFGRDFKTGQKVILRDYLAIELNRLANERTLLSYVRSSLYLLLGSIALYQLKAFANFEYLALTTLIFCVIGAYRFMLLKRSLKHFYYKSEDDENV
jgi:putative membrane protein